MIYALDVQANCGNPRRTESDFVRFKKCYEELEGKY